MLSSAPSNNANPVKVFETAGKGKGYRATKPIKKKVVITCEEADINTVESRFFNLYCSFCFEHVGEVPFKKCGACQCLYYCSVACQKDDWHIHKFECKPFKILSPTIHPTIQLVIRYLAKAGLDSTFVESFDKLCWHDKRYEDHRPVLDKYLCMLRAAFPESFPRNLDYKKIFCTLITNSFGESYGVGGVNVLQYFGLKSSLYNHSCDPNARYHLEGRFIQVIATKNIAAGEEVTIGYIDSYAPKADRRAKLLRVFNFECNCPACLRQANDAYDPFILDQSHPLNIRLARVKALLKRGKHNLVIYYMYRLEDEIKDKIRDGTLKEMDQIMGILFKKSGKSHELTVDVEIPKIRSSLFDIGLECWTEKARLEGSKAPAQKIIDGCQRLLEGKKI